MRNAAGSFTSHYGGLTVAEGDFIRQLAYGSYTTANSQYTQGKSVSYNFSNVFTTANEFQVRNISLLYWRRVA